jgi:hypothetical protein
MLIPIGLVVLALAIAAAASLGAADRLFRRRFVEKAQEALLLGGRREGGFLTEADLRELLEPIARWLRWSGAVGRKRISSVRLEHGGRFRTDARRPWMPIRGEYVVTTGKPAFQWYGKLRLAPGVNVVAIDSYLEGRGRMWVKALSAFTLADARSPEIARSAFARCIVELTAAPTFFLDRERVRWERVDAGHARCTVTDAHLSAEADVYVNDDGSLDRIVVMRPYDRGGGRTTLERFTGKASRPRSFGGRMLASRIDGTWNLPDGDLHCVAFEIERASFE